MFGMGMGEIIVILIVALLFLGPDKLPEAAKTISKGIRDFRRQTRELQESLEGDEQIGGAIRDLKSALRGDELQHQLQEHRRKATETIRQATATAQASHGAAGDEGTTPAITAGSATADAAESDLYSGPADGSEAADDEEAAPGGEAGAEAGAETGSKTGAEAGGKTGGKEVVADAALPLIRPSAGAVNRAAPPTAVRPQQPSSEQAKADPGGPSAEANEEADEEADKAHG